jgi:hypothetical protein
VTKRQLPGEEKFFMTIRYKKGLAYLFIAMGGLNLLLGLNLLRFGIPHFSIFIGIIILVLGIGYLTKPYATVTDREFIFLAMIGPIKRTLAFDSLDRVRIENNKISIQTDRGWQPVPIAKFLVHSEDWKALKEFISSYRA